jgi:hypothetical protein
MRCVLGFSGNYFFSKPRPRESLGWSVENGEKMTDSIGPEKSENAISTHKANGWADFMVEQSWGRSKIGDTEKGKKARDNIAQRHYMDYANNFCDIFPQLRDSSDVISRRVATVPILLYETIKQFALTIKSR